MERWLAAVITGDADAALHRVSEDPGVLLIGTDPNEWWEGDARAVMVRQLEETGGMPATWGRIQAWEEGSVGWASAQGQIAWEGNRYDARMTFVFHLEHGDWKIVQGHVSLPQSNESIGMTLTTTLDELERTVRREQPDVTAACAVDGTVTIVFTDIVDSTVLTSRLGDQAWLEALHTHDRVIRDTVAAHGGTVVETQGDGSCSRSRARAAPSRARARSRARSTGPSPGSRRRSTSGSASTPETRSHEADRFYGTTVHYAARVASNALGGEVLVSNLVHELVAGSGVAFRENREVELKGLNGSHRLFAVDG